MQSIIDSINESIGTNPVFAVVLVFLGGILTATNPCVLAMIPLLVGVVLGREEKDSSVLKWFFYSFSFVAGLAATFTFLGVLAAFLGTIFGDVSHIWNYIIFGVCLIMGLHLLHFFSIPFPSLNIKPVAGGIAGMFIMGFIFGFVSTPCVVPVLLVILTYLAGSESSVTYGGFLLFIFSIGHSILILIAGTSAAMAKKMIESKKLSRLNLILQKVAGIIIMAVGVYFLLKIM